MDGKLSDTISKDRKWTVRRLRRRARSSRLPKNQVTEKEKLNNEEKEKDSTSEGDNPEANSQSSDNGKVNVISDSSLLVECGLMPPSSSNTGPSTEPTVKETQKTPVKNENIVNAEKMLFGFSLGKHHVSNIELDSDQESTDGEEESIQKCEVPERLTPDWLLWYVLKY